MIADLNGEKAEQTATEIAEQTGGEVCRVGCDITRQEDIEDCVPNAFLWLASPVESWVSGQTIQVSGGGKQVRLIPE
jgi:NAD(P)-dependent dehydrogenase (short-subunit alcohol dehydrogenase family)